ncbi:MAG: hypothetical protein J0I09_08595 [Sphingobacteriia bacterium]|nr:hypothetical protein [Sphingobacteriia bacterium]
MNMFKRYAGIVWMLVSPLSIWFLLQTAISEINKKPGIDTKIQWGVFIIIFIPIGIGLLFFGYYALKGEYDHLPERSDELEQ